MKTTLLGIAVVIIVGAAGLFVYVYFNPVQQGPSVPEVVAPYRATLEGEFVCLPHKDTNGPRTEECAYGMRLADGMYYALDFNAMSQTLPDGFRTGDQFSASGLVTPVEYLNSDHWRIYPITGIFTVTDSVLVNGKPASRAVKISAGINETVSGNDVTITPLKVEEDSRCPSDVQCIWAGTVKVRSKIMSGLGESTMTIELGKAITTEAEEITIASVEPAKKSGEEIASSLYRFTFEVRKR